MVTENAQYTVKQDDASGKQLVKSQYIMKKVDPHTYPIVSAANTADLRRNNTYRELPEAKKRHYLSLPAAMLTPKAVTTRTESFK